VLRQVAEGVLLHESEFIQSNAVIVQGPVGALLVDVGILDAEMTAIADDLRYLGQPVVAAFSTHPHWDHLLWHARLGAAPRYGTARCAAEIRAFLSDPGWRDDIVEELPPEFEIPLELLGLITSLPAGATRIPWDGPHVRVIEHQAHASGHAALTIEARRVLVAGDMLSDVLVPMLDLNRASDPIEEYLAALRLLEGEADRIDVFIPGHGSVGGSDELRARIDRDRAYVQALRDGAAPNDPRIGPSAREGWEWVSDVHAGQVQGLAQRNERHGTPG
jgi:glyoxylase-like metal-dependent hydrolase (beta-lactamase superfamily II)